MKITIITPTFNSEKTIEKNILSIVKQSYAPLEHIIVDNQSSDQTLEIAKKLYDQKSIDLKIICEPDCGIADAFNKGIKASSGEIVAILNSDDEYFNDSVLKKVSNSFSDPTVDFIHGDMLFVDDIHGTNVRQPLFSPLTYAMPFNHPTMFLRKKVYHEIGLFNIDYRYVMDLELICRMYDTPNHCHVKGFYLEGEPITIMHSGGLSWTHELQSIDEYEKALKQHNFWSSAANRYQSMRRVRIKTKNLLTSLGLRNTIKLWRYFKWRW